MLSIDKYRLYEGDNISILKSFPDESIDLVITDPAYESLEAHRSIGTTTRLQNWFSIFPNSRYVELLSELYRVMKKNSHLYIFSDDETSDVLKSAVAEFNSINKKNKLTWWKRIVWDKMVIGMGYHYRNQHEFIVFLEKGKRKLNNLSIPSVLKVKRIKGNYPTEKPSELCKILVENSSRPGELVLDIFCGSSSTGVASIVSGRKYIGIDNSIEAMSYSCRILDEELKK